MIMARKTSSSSRESFAYGNILDRALTGAKRQVHYVPGEHNTSTDGKAYLERYGKSTKGSGWYSFDQKGVCFTGR
jgi:hypothetical protein